MVATLREFEDYYPYIRGMIASCGFRRVGVPYTWLARERGYSKARFYHLIDQALNAIISLSNVPMRLCMFFGFGVAFLSILWGLVGLIWHLIHGRTGDAGIPTLITALFFFFRAATVLLRRPGRIHQCDPFPGAQTAAGDRAGARQFPDAAGQQRTAGGEAMMFPFIRWLLLFLGVLLVNMQLTMREANYAGSISADFAAAWLTRSVPGLIVVALLGMAVAILARTRFRHVILTDAPPTNASTSHGCWNLAGWGVLIAGFGFLEWMQPYYFTQDDALLGELPGILLGFRSLWDGVFPDWNPYVFLGAPLATIGFWAITYPPQALAYAIARHLLGNEFATMDVFAALHLIAAFLATRHLSRRIGMGAFTANLAALLFVFAGCNLIMGRCWHAFVALPVWLPLMGIAIQRFCEGPVGWKWIIGVGVVLGLSYHAGFPQITAIIGMFLVFGVATVMIAERLPWRRALPAAPAILLGVGLAAPLLLHHLQWIGSGGVSRQAPAEDGIYEGLAGAVLPYPLVEAALPVPWGNRNVEKMGQFYFFGGLFAVLFTLQISTYWVYWPERAAWGRAWWVPCGMFALLMTLGEPAYLWKGLAHLPLSSIFLRYSFRFYPWLALAKILGGGLMLERFLAIVPRRRLWQGTVGGVMIGVLGWHLAMCQSAFYIYGFLPIPPLPAEFETIFHPYPDKGFIGPKNSRRIASWTQQRSPAADHFVALPLNLPHYYQVPSIFGYDPVVEGQPLMGAVIGSLEDNPVLTCKKFGVGLHVISYSDAPALSPNPRIWTLERTLRFEPAYRGLLKADLKTLAQVGGTSVKERCRTSIRWHSRQAGRRSRCRCICIAAARRSTLPTWPWGRVSRSISCTWIRPK